MRISLIAALSDEGVIGRDNSLPWRLPDDLKRFKKLTLNKPILMGRKTWDSIGRPLPQRTNIVLTRSESFQPEGAVVVRSVVEALVEAEGSKELMVIGGADLYRQWMPKADRMYLTRVHGNVEGDVRFPDWNPTDWRESKREEHPADENHEFPYTYTQLDRIERSR